jgi:hypothetical protein
LRDKEKRKFNDLDHSMSSIFFEKKLTATHRPWGQRLQVRPGGAFNFAPTTFVREDFCSSIALTSSSKRGGIGEAFNVNLAARKLDREVAGSLFKQIPKMTLIS